MLVYQTNPVRVQLFSYVNTFFCHVVVPNQSCESSTLFLYKHFLLSCVPILWEFNSFLVQTLSFACFCAKPIQWEFNSFLILTLSFVMLLYQTNPVRVQLFTYVNTFFCHVDVPNQSCGSSTLYLCKHFLLPCWCTYQTNPVGVELFTYVNTFFCHVGVPKQSCESSTLFLCKHFLLSCWRTKPILWELNSFPM